MAWQVKYWYNYRDINNVEHRVDVLENTAETLTAVECSAGENAFETNYNCAHKLIPVRGSLARFALLAQNNNDFADLYTADMLKFKVNHYRGAELIGTFYMDSELFNDPFSDIDNYPVNFSANDGFNLLERIDYLTAAGEKYTGIATQWSILTAILGKLALDWNNIYVGLSTTIPGVTIAESETLFHKHYNINDNFYNEDGDSESCRKVLDAIIESAGAYIEQKNGSLYISDLSYIDSDTAQPFKRYNASTFAYIDTVNINPNIGDISTIGVLGEESNRVIQAGFNKQKIVYSPYRDIRFLDYKTSVADFYTELSTNNYGNGDYAWSETLYQNSAIWNKQNLGAFAKALSTAGSKQGDQQFYLRIGRYEGTASESHLTFTAKKQLPYLIPASGYFLRIDISALFRTKTGYDNPNEAGVPINYGVIFLKIKIGNKVYVRSTTVNTWRDVIVGGFNFFRLEYYKVTDYKLVGTNMNYQYGAINDQYITAAYQKMFADRSVTSTPPLIPLGSGFAGDILELTVYGWKTGNNLNAQEDDVATAVTLDCRIEKIKLSITDAAGNEVNNNDLEYIKTLDPKYKNERETIKLICGTNSLNIPFERGGILGYNGTNYYYIQSWSRAGFTSLLENLLLRTSLSNYRYPSIVLTISVNLTESVFGYLTYNNWLPGKKLMVADCTVNHADAVANVTLIEFNKDNIPLNE